MGGGRLNKRERAQNTSRPNTRGSRPKLTDPVTNTNNLNARLKSLGLYAANTIGDGNCLFRALSDQLYGSPAKHLELRQEICDFIEERKDQYAGFIEDERGIDTHLDNMRVPGTYGGHVELSVFARLKRRDVKVIQPEVCFVIEHKHLVQDDDDDVPSTSTGSPKRRRAEAQLFPMTEGTIYVAYHDWEHFSSVRNIKGPHHGLPKVQEQPEEDQENARPQRTPVKATISKHKLKALRGKVPIQSLINGSSTTNQPKPSTSKPSKPDPFDSRESSPLTSLSQDSLNEGTTSSAPSSLAPVTPPDGQDAGRRSGSGLEMRLRSRLGVQERGPSRSPKRTFGESDLEDGAEEGSSSGRRVRRKAAGNKPASGSSILSSASPPSILPPPSTPDEAVEVEKDADEEEDEEDKSVLKLLDDGDESDSSLSPPPPGPKELQRLRKSDTGLLEPGISQTSDATAPPSSYSPSSRPSPAPESQETEIVESQSQSSQFTKPLTRRQRRTLGLPKHGNGSGGGNVIVIPGGRHPSRVAMRAEQARRELVVAVKDGGAEGEGVEVGQQQHEWERNGSGRKDSRGFVILNI